MMQNVPEPRLRTHVERLCKFWSIHPESIELRTVSCVNRSGQRFTTGLTLHHTPGGLLWSHEPNGTVEIATAVSCCYAFIKIPVGTVLRANAKMKRNLVQTARYSASSRSGIDESVLSGSKMTL